MSVGRCGVVQECLQCRPTWFVWARVDDHTLSGYRVGRLRIAGIGAELSAADRTHCIPPGVVERSSPSLQWDITYNSPVSSQKYHQKLCESV